MKNRKPNGVSRAVTSALVVLALVASTFIPAMAQTKRRTAVRRRAPVRRVVEPRVVYHNVNAGQTIRVRLNQQITSETARVGDQFTTTVIEPVFADGVEVIPSSSIITGRVTTVNRASRKSKAGTLGVHFVALRLPSGISRAINGDLIDTAESMHADNEGGVSGRSATRRNVVFIGGGAATGALIGAIAGGGKGAGIGALVGGGLGAAGAVFSKGHEAVVKSGTQFSVVLNQTLSLPEFRSRI